MAPQAMNYLYEVVYQVEVGLVEHPKNVIECVYTCQAGDALEAQKQAAKIAKMAFNVAVDNVVWLDINRRGDT